MENKQKKGISLIVLVITIIVMIILAAAIILSLNGSGIIGKANEAKTSSDLANAKYVAAIAKAEWDLMNDDEKQKAGNDFSKYLKDKLEETGVKTGVDGTVTVSKDGAINEVYVGEDGRKAIIPEGFTVSTNKSEDTVTEGLVIKDAAGNEFVWVPVDDYGKFEQITYNYTQSYFSQNPHTEPYVTEDYTEEQVEYLAMRESVEANKGFYIGRYEAGTTTERKEKISNKTTELVVQKDKFVYNNVCWRTKYDSNNG